MSLNEIKHEELKKYLYSNSVFGFTVSIRKNYLIYLYKRLFNGIRLSMKVKVDKKTKYVESVNIKGVIYTDFDEVKKVVE